ncbi:MAG: hypothetical protein GFH27_549283n417 [Chloroflexi bacterium AL-W]|nr:hypothetical protein [Chloroflexi bacterium AL-N1]NOK64462.1 hypothetical protein [Chloroflexi bacterium AL-N10]NOK75704.1 hypothetical protein [Chloroflexi bacterium AL-N5]NOK80538.1 hypothetical protein [Chloroflexi bacterium AL-W]NOK87052.1 hypothetical protein [Chloroflexi bacterium AL-N15]
MARTTLATQTIRVIGTEPVWTSAEADGHKVEGSGGVFIYVRNTGSATRSITIPTTFSVVGLDLVDAGGDVLAGEDRIFGSFRGDIFNQDDGTVHIDIDDPTDVQIAAFKL